MAYVWVSDAFVGILVNRFHENDGGASGGKPPSAIEENCPTKRAVFHTGTHPPLTAD
jgi:hypothetical protein